jgi:sugar (pentulose or hexulose) kinase
MKYILGVDLGTTAIKAAVFDETGKECGSKTVEYTLLTPYPGWAELEVQTYIDTFITASHAAMERAGITADQIDSVGMSAQGETTICLDENNEPLRPAIVWMDLRAKEEAEYIEEVFGQAEIQKHTGQPGMDAIWPAGKLLWLKKNEPEVFSKTAKFVQLKGYFSYLLTGTMADEDSILCTTMYWDINTRKYWPEMMDLLQITEEQLPVIMKQGESVGEITEEGAKMFGLSTGTVLNIGALDQACGALGVGNVRPGSFSDSTGSNLSTVAIVDKLILDPSMQMPCFASAIPGKYMLHAFSSGGMVLKWFRDVFCELEKNIETESGEAAFDQINREVQKVAPGCDGLIMIPHLQGSGPPDTDNNQKGVYFGITLAHKKAHFARAIMESIAMVLRRMIEAMEPLGVEVKQISVLGGGSKSDVWCQLKADATGVPFNIMSTTESSACLGAAILAGVASGIWASPEKAADMVVKADATYVPNADAKEVYDKLFEKTMKLQNGLKVFYEDSSFRE